ncbi:spore germination protein [Oceanobacillus limi]|uniref:Spore germination protein n=1 Tax=Oceanobacillus limi TaxID=930131 RepID=A0A1I0CC76_9BACI|nr:Ger(x)C family spore germination protein [Oceanobacillus limi]SET17008.1 spore germination protein [Oceanobacillus limi]
MKNRKRRYPIIPLFCLLICSGCWDSQDLESRAFNYVVAIDLADKSRSDHFQITVTNQFVVPAGVGTSTVESAGQRQAFRNVSSSGESLVDINREISTMLSRTISSQHLKVILISSEVAKQPELFGKIMDFFLRDREMRRGMKVAFVEGNAAQLLQVKPEHINIPGEYMEQLLENHSNAGTIEPLKVGDVQEGLLSDLNFIAPRLKATEDMNIEFDGISVYNSRLNQLTGSLDREETKGLNFLLGKVKDGTIKVNLRENIAVIENLDLSHQVSADVKDETNIRFTIDLFVSGSIAEVFGQEDVTNDTILKELETAYQKAVEKKAKETIQIVQEELQTDALRLDRYLMQHHYQLWKKIRKNWDTRENYFSNSEIKVNVETNIEHPGTSNKTKEGDGD